MSGTVRALFANEGDLGGQVLGHVTIEENLRRGMSARNDIDATFVRLPPMPRAASLAAAQLPVLNGLDLDLKIPRWHAVQAVRARRLVERSLAVRSADVLYVDSHTIAFGLGKIMRRIPTLVSVDATVQQWQEQGLWHTARPWSPAMLAPSVAVERRTFARSFAVVAMSEWSAAGVRAVHPDTRVEVIHSGVDVERFHPAEIRQPRDRPRLLFVGGRFAEKGGDDLLDALHGLLGISVDLDVVTRAPLETRPGLRVHSLGNDDPRLPELFRQADAFVLPSHADAVPWVLVEALASGTPPIVSDVAALPSLVGDAGVVVPPRRPDLLRQAVVGLLGDESTLEHRRRRSRRIAEERYDVRGQGARLAALLLEAAGR